MGTIPESRDPGNLVAHVCLISLHLSVCNCEVILLSTVPYLNLNVSSVYSFGKVCVVVNELRFCCDIFLDGRSVTNVLLHR